MLLQAQHTVTINRPVEQVFAYVTDGERDRTWRPTVVDVKRESGEGLGSVYKQGVKGPGGKRVDADYRVTRFEPGASYGFEVTSGPVRPGGRYTFEGTPDGTRLTFELRIRLKGLKGLMKGAVQKSMDAEVQGIDNLKRVMEASQS
jgi:uncharacterized protein YndB with AHSA1/START domain